MLDPYVYPGTDILKNKFNEKSEAALESLEADFIASRLRDIITKPVDGFFNFEHLCRVHAVIFQDIYDWAGKPRTIPIEKSEPVLGGLSIEYAEPNNIERDATTVLNKMKSVEWDTLGSDNKASCFSQLMAALWKVHPFREGNTRTVITFCCQFADCQGFSLDTDLFKDHSVFVRTALVAASAQFQDLGDRSQPQHLMRIVMDAMEHGQNRKPSVRKKLEQLNRVGQTAKPYKSKTHDFER